MRSRTLSLGVLFLFGGACSQIIGLSDYEKTDDSGETGGKNGGGAGAGSGGRSTGGRGPTDAGSSGDAGAAQGGSVVHTGGTGGASGTGGSVVTEAGAGGVGGEAGAAGADTGGSSTGGTISQGGTTGGAGKGGAATGGAVGKGGSGGTLGTGGVVGTGGKAGTGGAIATGGTLNTGGKAGTGGAIPTTGGTLNTGGKAGTGGSLSGGTGGTGGCAARELLTDGAFDNPAAGVWEEDEDPPDSSLVIVTPAADLPTGVTPHSGGYAAWLGGLESQSSWLDQVIAIPAGTTQLVLSCRYQIFTEDLATTGHDWFEARLVDDSLKVVYSFVSLSNVNAVSAWSVITRTVDVSALTRTPTYLEFASTTDATLNTNFFLDSCSLQARCQ